LSDDNGAREDQSTDREKLPVPALAGARGQFLQFDFLETVGSELRFKFALVHGDLLWLFALFKPDLDQPADGFSP
jgi:hypothetical protein